MKNKTSNKGIILLKTKKPIKLSGGNAKRGTVKRITLAEFWKLTNQLPEEKKIAVKTK